MTEGDHTDAEHAVAGDERAQPARGVRDAGAPDAVIADPRVVIGLATYRRPEGLALILPGLLAQCAELSPHGRVVVVDNDPDAGARAQVQQVIDAGQPVTYVHEPQPGIAAARNAALADALGHGDDAIVFVDDDEEATPGWLRTLVDFWASHDRCAGVSAPVVTVFDGGEPDLYVRSSGVFDRVRRDNGVRVLGAATNNLLLSLGFLRDHDLRFDDRFGLSGGSDTMLTRTITSLGGVIRWCDGAEVLDHIPGQRTTAEWVRHRVSRQANSWARVQVELAAPGADRWRKRADLAAHAGVLAARGVVAGRRATTDAARAQADRSLSQARGVWQAVRGGVRFDYQRAAQ